MYPKLRRIGKKGEKMTTGEATWRKLFANKKEEKNKEEREEIAKWVFERLFLGEQQLKETRKNADKESIKAALKGHRPQAVRVDQCPPKAQPLVKGHYIEIFVVETPKGKCIIYINKR